MKAREASEQATHENIENPSNKGEQEVAQVLWKEETKMPTPQCRR
jgi:hypothetical protein